MDGSEFDKFADEYTQLLGKSLGGLGDSPDYYARYKVQDATNQVRSAGLAMRDILDFGCGVGHSIPLFREFAPQSRLVGVDVSSKSLEVARSRFPGLAELNLFDGSTLPFASASFDLVFTACVFHHIPARAQAGLLAEIHRVLRPGGSFIIFEHNPYNPLTVRVVNRCPFDADAVLLSSPNLRRRLNSAGFDRCATRYRLFFPHALRSLRPWERWLTWCPLGAQYYLFARKSK